MRRVGCSKSERRDRLFPGRRFLADLLKERPPDLGHGHAVETSKPEGGSEGDLPFVLLNFMQGRNGEAGPLRDLSQGQPTLGAQGAKTMVHRDSDAAVAGQ